MNESLNKSNKEYWLEEIAKLEERLKNINSVQYIHEIQFILSSRIVIDDFFEYFELQLF